LFYFDFFFLFLLDNFVDIAYPFFLLFFFLLYFSY
jgi:hypothetical protein